MLTFLNILLYVLKSVEVLAVTLLILIAIDLGVYMHKQSHFTTFRAKHRQVKSATTGVFDLVVRAIAWLKVKHTERQKRNEQLRIIRQKEYDANEGFFEGSYVRGFDTNGAMMYRGCQIMTEKGREYYKEMGKLADGRIFENTREI